MFFGDIGNIRVFTVKNSLGKAINLNDVTSVILKVRKLDGVTDDKVCEMLEPKKDGKVRYVFNSTDITSSGMYLFQIKVVYKNNDIFHGEIYKETITMPL